MAFGLWSRSKSDDIHWGDKAKLWQESIRDTGISVGWIWDAAMFLLNVFSPWSCKALWSLSAKFSRGEQTCNLKQPYAWLKGWTSGEILMIKPVKRSSELSQRQQWLVLRAKHESCPPKPLDTAAAAVWCHISTTISNQLGFQVSVTTPKSTFHTFRLQS